MYFYLQVPVPDWEIGSYIRRYWSGGRVGRVPKVGRLGNFSSFSSCSSSSSAIVLGATSDFFCIPLRCPGRDCFIDKRIRKGRRTDLTWSSWLPVMGCDIISSCIKLHIGSSAPSYLYPIPSRILGIPQVRYVPDMYSWLQPRKRAIFLIFSANFISKFTCTCTCDMYIYCISSYAPTMPRRLISG